MTHLWKPEKTIEAPAALRLIQEQFPELRAKEIQLLGAGWDNTAFLIDGRYIFRFPRREISVPLLEAEWHLLPKLAPTLPLPIPVPKWHGKPSPVFSWPFIGYEKLPGVTACYANLSEKERVALAAPIGRFLAAVHNSDLSIMQGCPIPADNLSRIEWRWLQERVKKNFEELSLIGIPIPDCKPVFLSLQNLREPAATNLVHGDFYIRHLLLNEQHQLAGVIDWGDIHLGDPAIDLAIAHSFLPPIGHKDFRDAYSPISDETWRLAKLRAFNSVFSMLLYGHHAQDPDLVRESLTSLNYLTIIDN